jgi:nucleoside-diphosphate-sugar epimerase
MAPLKILITGATGYIGGAVLTTLLNTTRDNLKEVQIAALVRGEDQARVLESKGVKPIVFKSLDETELLTTVASEYDAIIHTASGFHTESARALVTGAGKRVKETGKDVFYIHTSGTSNLADRPITKTYSESRVFSDKHDDIYAYEQHRDALTPYAQRTTDLVVVKTGLEVGVKTYIIMSPTIYGIGSGLFNNQSIQIPIMVRTAKAAGQAQMIGRGEAEWDHVHIDDLAVLYELILSKVIGGEQVPSGEKGIFFSETGRHSWVDVSREIAKAGVEVGALSTDEVKIISLKEAADLWNSGNEFVCELGFASK